jgi:hypothetical protein
MHAVLAVAALAVVALCACGRDASVGSNSSSEGGASLNAVSAGQVVRAIDKAGLPAANPHDITAEQCPKLHCKEAVGADTISVYKFAITGLAQKYAGSITDDYQVEDIVVVFTQSVSADLKRDYESVVARTAA